jgi:hypothetical protein
MFLPSGRIADIIHTLIARRAGQMPWSGPVCRDPWYRCLLAKRFAAVPRSISTTLFATAPTESARVVISGQNGRGLVWHAMNVTAEALAITKAGKRAGERIAD